MELTEEAIQKKIDHWRAEQDKALSLVQKAEARYREANGYHNGWVQALGSLKAAPPDPKLAASLDYSVSPSKDSIEPSFQIGPAESTEHKYNWQLMVEELEARGRSAKVTVIRDALMARGRLSKVKNIAYTQVFSNIERKPKIFYSPGRGQIALVDVEDEEVR